jgi:hypothetical protein
MIDPAPAFSRGAFDELWRFVLTDSLIYLVLNRISYQIRRTVHFLRRREARGTDP